MIMHVRMRERVARRRGGQGAGHEARATRIILPALHRVGVGSRLAGPQCFGGKQVTWRRVLGEDSEQSVYMCYYLSGGIL